MPLDCAPTHAGLPRAWPEERVNTVHPETRLARTDFTLASTSPVVGQTLSKTSPEPVHSPSYTPWSSVSARMSRAERTAEAREERPRASGARRREVSARRVIMVVEVQA